MPKARRNVVIKVFFAKYYSVWNPVLRSWFKGQIVVLVRGFYVVYGFGSRLQIQDCGRNYVSSKVSVVCSGFIIAGLCLWFVVEVSTCAA